MSVVWMQCTEHCTCSLEKTVCYVEDCDQDFPLVETYILHIYGMVCPAQRKVLSVPYFHNTIKMLYDDYCSNIPNCRLVNIYCLLL